MRIDHVALWTHDIERCKQFYTLYFGAIAGTRYVNSKKGFESCFLSFTDGARIEAMKTSAFRPAVFEPGAQRMGFIHLAISVGSTDLVDDGYYESVVVDPDGNRIEITA